MPRIVQTKGISALPGWLAWLLAVLFVFSAGCMSSRAPRVDIQTPRGATIRQRGDAEAPAAVETAQTVTETPLPAGSAVTITPDGAVNIVLTEATTVRSETTRDTATAAASFSPPSPAELAKGFGVKLWGIVGVVGFVLAIVLAARGHAKAAVMAGAGAVVAPLIGHFVNSTAGLVVAAVCVAAAVALFAAWHIMRVRGAIVTQAASDTPAKSHPAA